MSDPSQRSFRHAPAGAAISPDRECAALRAALDATALVAVTDADGLILEANDRLGALIGAAPEALAGQPLDMLRSDLHSRGFYAALWRVLRQGQVWRGDVCSRAGNGRLIWVDTTVAPVLDSQGRPERYYVIGHDITESRQAEERLSFLALRDPLTELPNRRLFSDRLEHELETVRRTGASLAVLVLDLDRFKSVNEGLGRAIGDRLLRAIGQRLRAEVRDSDTVARLGDDEFAILLEDIEGRTTAAAVARKLVEALREPMTVGDHRLTISASVGVAVYPEDGTTADALLRNADTAMDGAKDVGRDSFKLYAAEMGRGRTRRLTLLNGLQSALFDGGFRVHYQPQVNLETSVICGAEALLRWTHPVLGAVTPSEFVPLLEETGLIGSVGEWVLHTACRDARLWGDEGKPLRVAVNVSYRQIQQGTLPEIVRRALDASGLAPAFLELELTESMLAEDTRLTIDVLKKCRDLGVSISIDDFGTGYSSLAHLKRFPVNVLKTDKCFIQGGPGERHDTAIITAVATLAQRLGLTLVAEGIEEAASADYLRQLGCDIGQGFYFGRPMPRDSLTQMLAG